jgi:predicted GNAT family acetyltransferase
MNVERLAGAADFLAATLELRTAEPLLTNVVGSVAQSVLLGRVYEREFWWVVRDEAGAVVGCAMRTAPHPLITTPMPVEAAQALGRAVAAADPEVPRCAGPRDVVEALLAGLAEGSITAAATVAMTDLVYVLGAYLPPRPVAGSPRLATSDDLDLLEAWHVQFGIDAGLPMHDPRTSVENRLAQQALWLWEVDAAPVSMAGHANPVETPAGVVGRVGPVYTPAALRGRGYGSAVTAAVVEELQPRCEMIMLFADADNPTSNKIYAAMGFEVVAELVETELAGP